MAAATSLTSPNSLGSNFVFLHDLRSGERINKLLKNEARSRQGSRAAMTLAGASLILLTTPVGWIACPVMAGIMLLAAGGFFAYRRCLAKKINDHTLNNNDDNTLDNKTLPTIATIDWKKDLKEGFTCLLLPGIGAFKVYIDDRRARKWQENINSTDCSGRKPLSF